MCEAPEAAEVVVVGGGPVGMGLAIELGQRNIRAIVVERYAAPQAIPKGQNLTQRTMEHFHFWGVEGAVRAARTIPSEYGIGGLTAYGTLLSEYSYDWMQRELVRPFYFTDNERLPQYATETVLRRRAEELASVATLYGWSAETVHQDEGEAHVLLAERAGAGRRTLRAQYVVGCDGSRSTVRTQAGISQALSDHDRLMVLLVFRSHALHRLLERYPGKSFYSVLHPELEGYWKFFGRVDLGSTWFFHAPVPPGTTRDNFDFRQYLYAAAGAEFDVEFDHIGFWDLRFAVAETYRAGRILGWKLAAVLQGWGGKELLGSYDRERRPVFQSTARDFIEKAIADDRNFLAAFNPVRDRAGFERAWAQRKAGARSEVHGFEPNYEGSPVVWGPPGGCCSARGAHAFKARAGHHLAPQPLSSGRNTFEGLGTGFALLSFDGEEAACGAFAAAADHLMVPLEIIRDRRTGGPERYQARYVLVRPDQFVAWAGNEVAPEAATILRTAAGMGVESTGAS